MAEGVRTRLTAAQGRKFGLTVGLAFTALGGVFLWKGRLIAALAALTLAAALLAGAAFAPSALGPVERAWMAMARAISRVTTPLVMGLAYFLVVLPIGLAMRASGRNPITHSATGGSYWVNRAETAEQTGGMERQF